MIEAFRNSISNFQMNSVKHFIVANAPNPIPRLLTLHSSRVMVDCIRQLRIISGAPVWINDIEMRMIELVDGTRLISHVANRSERKVLGFVAREHNLDDTYSKALLDTITRYVYPHVGGAVLQMDYPIDKRLMFHPQQKNFLLEDQSLSMEERSILAEKFSPQESWHCLDIGAFLGHGAIWLRKRIGPTGKIICVEASQHNHAVIDEVVKLNDLTNIQSHHGAIWRTDGETIAFNMTTRQGNAIDSGVVKGTVSVDVTTVSVEYLTNALGCAADLMSLTVNGAEVEAIEGLITIDKELLPRRIIAPGWYMKEGKPRSDYLEPLFNSLGYKYVMTHGRLMFAWLDTK